MACTVVESELVGTASPTAAVSKLTFINESALAKPAEANKATTHNTLRLFMTHLL
jgi:hypothetical protein